MEEDSLKVNFLLQQIVSKTFMSTEFINSKIPGDKYKQLI